MMNDATMTTGIEAAEKLETVTCSRCGGTGHYSYCYSHGTVCFKCGGRKVVYTKRGQAASYYLEGLRSVRADSLKPGDQIQYQSITWGGTPYTAWYTVGTITPTPAASLGMATIDGQPILPRTDCLTLELTSKKAGPLTVVGITPETMVRIAQSAEQKTATFRAALAYQATLTLAGTVRKVGKVK